MIETPFHIVIYCLKNVLLDPVSRACSSQSQLMHQLADLTFEVSEALTLRIFSQPVLCHLARVLDGFLLASAVIATSTDAVTDERRGFIALVIAAANAAF